MADSGTLLCKEVVTSWTSTRWIYSLFFYLLRRSSNWLEWEFVEFQTAVEFALIRMIALFANGNYSGNFVNWSGKLPTIIIAIELIEKLCFISIQMWIKRVFPLFNVGPSISSNAINCFLNMTQVSFVVCQYYWP